MNRIEQIFAKDNKVFIAFVTAGYPSVSETLDVLDIVVDNGADIVELGFPFSDPTADGKVIQATSQFALDRGFKRDDYFMIMKKFRQTHPDTPIVVFSYFNPIYQYGTDNFIKRVHEVGGDAALIVDLPLEEQNDVLTVLNKYDLPLIQLVAPTTPANRLQRILECASGFIYQISLRGVTGMRDEVKTSTADQTELIRKYTDLPVALGFGISSVEQIRSVKSPVDGLVIGSALMDLLIANGSEYKDALGRTTRAFAKAIHERD